MKIYNKNYDIRKILLKRINYTSKIITYANPYSHLDKKTNSIISNNTNISRNINSTYIKDKNNKLNCDDDTFHYDDNEINNEDDEGYIILPDIDPPSCKTPNCSRLLNSLGKPFKDKDKTKYKKDILYYNYTLKTNGDEEDVDTLIKLIQEEINEIQVLIEKQIEIKKEVLYYDDNAKDCYEKLIEDYNNDDNKLIKKFQDKIDQYRIIDDPKKKTIDEINIELYKNKFEIII
jgi:hypothetical protein